MRMLRESQDCHTSLGLPEQCTCFIMIVFSNEDVSSHECNQKVDVHSESQCLRTGRCIVMRGPMTSAGNQPASGSNPQNAGERPLSLVRRNNS